MMEVPYTKLLQVGRVSAKFERETEPTPEEIRMLADEAP